MILVMIVILSVIVLVLMMKITDFPWGNKKEDIILMINIFDI